MLYLGDRSIGLAMPAFIAYAIRQVKRKSLAFLNIGGEFTLVLHGKNIYIRFAGHGIRPMLLYGRSLGQMRDKLNDTLTANPSFNKYAFETSAGGKVCILILVVCMVTLSALKGKQAKRQQGLNDT